MPHISPLLACLLFLIRNFSSISFVTLRCREERYPCTPLCVGSDNFGNSPQITAPRRSREIDQSTQRSYVGWFHVGWQGIGDQSDTVTQNAWFRCALCAAISGDISILIQTGVESWGRFPVPRICRWESNHL